jgi:hypothetical protein
MAYEKKPGQFSLFKNKHHYAGDTKPVMTGDGICPCCQKEIKLAVWGKQKQDGEKFYGGKMQEPRKADHQNERHIGREMDDEIPF